MIIYIDRLFLYATLSTYFTMRFSDGMCGGRRRSRQDVMASILGAVLFVVCFCTVAEKQVKEGGEQHSLWGILLGAYLVLYAFYCFITAWQMLRYRTRWERLIWLGKNVGWFLCGNALLGCLISGVQLLVPALGENFMGACLCMCLSGECVKRIPKWVRSRRKIRKCVVRIYHGEKKLRVRGFVDTGNLLRGPQGEQVCVLRENIYEELRGGRNTVEEGCIAYFGANGAVGTMPCIKVERLEIIPEQEATEQECAHKRSICVQTDVTMAKGGSAFCKGYDMLLPEWE